MPSGLKRFKGFLLMGIQTGYAPLPQTLGQIGMYRVGKGRIPARLRSKSAPRRQVRAEGTILMKPVYHLGNIHMHTLL